MLAKLKNYWTKLWIGYVFFMADTVANAQGVGGGAAKTSLQTLLNNKTFSTTITLGFGIYSAFKWFDYFNNFSTGDALRGIIVPAVLTYLAFNWQVVLGWVGLV